MLSLPINKIPISAAVSASRKKALVEALFAFHVARNETASARRALADGALL